MENAVHFVGFIRGTLSYANAVGAFGQPDFIHRIYDHRAVSMIAPGDVVIYAGHVNIDSASQWSFDDSAVN